VGQVTALCDLPRSVRQTSHKTASSLLDMKLSST
jgi:hypothetical protein